jgi:uncharacterized protein (DUF169 family)
VAISFTSGTAPELPQYEAPLAEPAPDGRTGRAAASCVYWMEAAERRFTTVPADHGNCSVGMVTHGLAGVEDVAGNADVAAVLEVGWIAPEDVARIPHVAQRSDNISYGPLAESLAEPDVVMLRVDGRQLMVLGDALPDLGIEGKPQCQVIPLATERGAITASLGCALSRARTGMRDDEMTCAIPAERVDEVLERLEAATRADDTVAEYAAADAQRFNRPPV